jgi:endonuclease V-like protein UPF0215 family
MDLGGLLKKETRILGLSAPRRTHRKSIIGTVFRGRLWLDAIVTYAPDESKIGCVPGLAAALQRTKQYSQIQAAIFSRENILQHKYKDFRRLSKLVKFPVFVITKEPVTKLPKNEVARILLNKKRISLWISDYNSQRAKELYLLGCNKDQTLPEAVRVAELIAEGLQQSSRTEGSGNLASE